jgi:trimeric autotransporter adhesin
VFGHRPGNDDDGVSTVPRQPLLGPMLDPVQHVQQQQQLQQHQLQQQKLQQQQQQLQQQQEQLLQQQQLQQRQQRMSSKHSSASGNSRGHSGISATAATTAAVAVPSNTKPARPSGAARVAAAMLDAAEFNPPRAYSTDDSVVAAAAAAAAALQARTTLSMSEPALPAIDWKTHDRYSKATIPKKNRSSIATPNVLHAALTEAVAAGTAEPVSRSSGELLNADTAVNTAATSTAAAAESTAATAATKATAETDAVGHDSKAGASAANAAQTTPTKTATTVQNANSKWQRKKPSNSNSAAKSATVVPDSTASTAVPQKLDFEHELPKRQSTNDIYTGASRSSRVDDASAEHTATVAAAEQAVTDAAVAATSNKQRHDDDNRDREQWYKESSVGATEGAVDTTAVETTAVNTSAADTTAVDSGCADIADTGYDYDAADQGSDMSLSSSTDARDNADAATAATAVTMTAADVSAGAATSEHESVHALQSTDGISDLQQTATQSGQDAIEAACDHTIDKERSSRDAVGGPVENVSNIDDSYSMDELPAPPVAAPIVVYSTSEEPVVKLKLPDEEMYLKVCTTSEAYIACMLHTIAA